MDTLKKEFSERLLGWKQAQSREMPWKGETNPYKIWLSEIILQQTRVGQGLKFYSKFISEFPDVHSLANAEERKVYKLWEGLGYYNRCRNLIISARLISRERNGEFPKTYNEIIKLKGVGEYTAAAIASFAYNQPHAVLDGNVFRVLSRIFGIEIPINSSLGKTIFSSLADELLDKKNAASYNQALMDFGAMICKPANPLCDSCIFKDHCYAYKNGLVAALPVKQKKVAVKRRWFYYLIIEHKNSVAIHQRMGKDIWQFLFEYYLIETEKEQDIKFILNQAEKENVFKKGEFEFISSSKLFTQRLSHQLISGQFIRIETFNKSKLKLGLQWVPKAKLSGLAFPKFINQFRGNENVERTLF